MLNIVQARNLNPRITGKGVSGSKYSCDWVKSKGLSSGQSWEYLIRVPMQGLGYFTWHFCENPVKLLVSPLDILYGEAELFCFALQMIMGLHGDCGS